MSGGGWWRRSMRTGIRRRSRASSSRACCPCFREKLADPACVLSPFFPVWSQSGRPLWRLSVSRAGIPPADDSEWIEVQGIARFFRRLDGLRPARLAHAGLRGMRRRNSGNSIPAGLALRGPPVYEAIPCSRWVAAEGGQREEMVCIFTPKARSAKVIPAKLENC